MFIKEAYQKRIQQQLSHHSPTFLKIKNKLPAIGSIKSGRLNFDNQQTFFNESDIPIKSKTLKQQTKDFKDPDILQLKKKKWNISVSSPRSFEKFEDSHEDVLHKIKHGFFDHGNPIKERKNKMYAGIDTRDHFQGWNVSTQISKPQKEENYHNILVNSLQNTSSFNQAILKSYSKPVQRYQRLRSFQKERFLNQSNLYNSLKQEFVKFNKDSSPQRTNAVAFKLLEETRRQKLKEKMFVSQDQIQLNKKFKASLSDSQKVNIIQRFSHNGSWSQVPWAQEGMAWSCCMNEQKESKGCVKIKVDNNKPNFASYNNA